MNPLKVQHDVHSSIIIFFLDEPESSENPANVNEAIRLNRFFAEAGYRCLHTNGNHTVWEGARGTVNVSRCELPTLTVTPKQ